MSVGAVGCFYRKSTTRERVGVGVRVRELHKCLYLQPAKSCALYFQGSGCERLSRAPNTSAVDAATQRPSGGRCRAGSAAPATDTSRRRDEVLARHERHRWLKP